MRHLFHALNRRPRATRAPGRWIVALGALAVLAVLAAAPSPARACACGCGVFEVGTASMFPTDQGGMLSVEYDFMNQDGNWSGSRSAVASANDDKRILTNFVTAGGRYMFSRAWGVGAEVPYWHRAFRTADGGDVEDFAHAAVGDMRVRAMYTGFSDDLSSGVSAGLKLPTGDYRYANFDRDTEIGTGSTDLLLGAYHVGPLTANRMWLWFVDGQWARPFAYAGSYRPGSELDMTAALSRAGDRVGAMTLSPLLEVIGAVRARDQGASANPGDSGYARVLLAPGLDAKFAGLRGTITADFPVYEHVNGNQLVAPALFKLELGHAF